MNDSPKKMIKLVDNLLNRTCWKIKKEVKCISKITGRDLEVILDIGAFLGLYSIYFAKRFKKVKIYSFEPVLLNYDILVKNMKLNNLGDRIIPFNFGFDNEEGDVLMGIPISRQDDCNTGVYFVKDKNEKRKIVSDVNCKMNRLSNFVKENNIKNIDMIKIDVEGKEMDILKDSVKLLYHVRYIHIEINKDFKSSSLISDFLRKNNFIYIKNTHNINELWRNKNYGR